MTAPARTAAFHAVRAIADGKADLPAALARTRVELADERDRSLAAEIVIGAERWRRSLDALVDHYARRPLAAIDRDVLYILRLSLFQLLHLDRVPASAVVHDAVDLTRQARKGSAAGFVNAVLRGTLRGRARLPLPSRPASVDDQPAALAYLGVTHSHPDWLVRRWLNRHGFDATERWVRFNNDTPRLTLRVNTLRATRDAVSAALAADGVETEATRHATEGLAVLSGNPLRTSTDGTFFVQDEASQLISDVVAARPGERILDLCASPGNKTMAMAADMGDQGLVVACDVRARRVNLLHRTIRTAGAQAVRLVHVPATGDLPFRASFDRVLVDAPCSGLGTIRRDPDLRWRRTEGDLQGLAAQQLTLLKRAADTAAAGGRLVYATCSSEPEENEAVVDAFLSVRRDFHLVDLRTEDIPVLAPFIDDRGFLRTLPFEHQLEAFFAAAMQRRAGA